MEVLVTYELDGEQGAVAVQKADYYEARDEAFKLVPVDAIRLSIRVNRDS